MVDISLFSFLFNFIESFVHFSSISQSPSRSNHISEYVFGLILTILTVKVEGSLGTLT